MGLRRISGSLIRQLRIAKGMTLTEVVGKGNGAFTEASLSAWELDKWEPRDESILALCAALECEFESISAEVVPA